MDTRDRKFSTRADAFEAMDDTPLSPTTEPTLGDIVNRRFGRRDAMRGALAVTAMTAMGGTLLTTARQAHAATPSFGFQEIPAGVDEDHHVAPGYTADILIRWGDPVVPGAPAFDPMSQTAAAQDQQFGYNNDFVGYVGLPFGSDNPEHGLLCVTTSTPAKR